MIHLSAGAGPQNAAYQGLPVYLDRFIGRTTDLELLSHHLLARGERLLTLTGPGGSGKTRLAITLAEQVSAAFAHGVLFVDCSSVREVSLLPPHLTARVGLALQRSGEGASLETLLEKRNLLLILDNLEQIKGVGAALGALLETLPQLHILATSRTPLHVRGERRYSLKPLGVNPASALDSEPSEALTLLLERARAVNPQFAQSETERSTLNSLTRLLDGLPLALELVASHADLFSPRQMLAQLERGRVLTRQGGQDRHRSLARAMQWSFELLELGQQHLFRQLGVFVRGFSFEAACAVVELDAPERPERRERSVLDALVHLAEHNLLVVEEGEPTRFRLLMTLRQFALEQLEWAGETALLREKHAWYYTAEANRLYDQWHGPEQLEALNTVLRDRAQLESALAWRIRHCTSEAEVVAGLNLLATLHYLYMLLDNLEGVYSNARNLYGALPRDHLTHRARLLEVQAQGAVRLGRLEEAQHLLEQAVTLARAHDQRDVLAGCLRTLSNLHLGRDNYADVAPLLEESVAVWRTVSGESDLTNTLHHLGIVYLTTHDLASARPLLEEVLILERVQGTPLGEIVILQSLAQLELECERWGLAEQHLRDSLALIGQVGLRWGGGPTLVKLADLLGVQGAFTEAEALLREVGGLYEGKPPTPRSVQYTLTRARLALLGEDLPDTALHLEAAFQASISGRYGFPLAAVCQLQARLYQALGHPDWAQAWLEGGDEALRLRPAQPHGLYPAERAVFEATLTPTKKIGAQGSPTTAAAPFQDEAELKTALRQLRRESPQTVQPVALPDNLLSVREREVLALLAKGHTNKRIAAQLKLSPATVDTHLRHIFAKLECKTRTEAVSQATQWGWLESSIP